jgi:folate-binding protein YgfZ
MNFDCYRQLLAGEFFIAPLVPRSLWKLSGPDAERYLNGQVTSDVTKLAEGAACYAAVCTAKGRMEGDVSIARHGGDFYLDADASLRESLGARLDKYLIADDAQFEDLSGEWKLAHAFGTEPPVAPEGGFIVKYARFGLPGHDIWSPAAGTALFGKLVDADSIEALRIEHAIPRWGAELSTNTLPPEAGPHMLAAISYTKGCYVGQETIARLKSVGHVNRTLVFLRSDSEKFPTAGAKLVLEGKEVGVVTSSGFSLRLEKGMALGYVQRQAAEEGILLNAGEVILTIAPPLSV